MNNMVNFILESGISLSVFAIIYMLLLRKETFFKLNRFFLLSSVLFSVVLPFLHFQVFNANPVMLSEITVTPYRNLIEAVTVYGKDLSGSIEQVILSANAVVLVYLAGVAFFLVRFLVRMLKIFLLVSRHHIQQMNGFKLVILEDDFSPFSFLNFVFISRSQQQEDSYNKLIVHELEHVKQGHTYDVLILELLAVFQWFNPFMWMLRRAITENHEYLADQAVLNSGTKRGYYKKLLLSQYIGGQFKIANNFNYSLIKKRIKMMSKIRSSKISNAKVVFGLFAAAVLVVVFACEQQETYLVNPQKGEEISSQNKEIKGVVDNMNRLSELIIDNVSYKVTYDSLGKIILTKKETPGKEELLAENEKVYNSVEKMPEFPGGEKALIQYITRSIIYPETAVEQKLQGKVYVSFVVRKDGSVADSKIERGVAQSLDREALRVVDALPQWKPGYQKGVPVNVKYTVPINFALE